MKDNITNWVLEKYKIVYDDKSITKEDIFYYTYGILHSEGYREKYASSLARELPRIPFAPNFRAFEKAGRDLAWLHLNYDEDDFPRYDLGKPLLKIPDAPKKISFARRKEKDPETGIYDHSKLKLDGELIYHNLPFTKYQVNGSSPIGWFVNRYGFTTHKDSGIMNYPLENKSSEKVRAIIERLVYVGVESDRIIALLPKEFEMKTPPDIDLESKSDWQPKPAVSSLDAYTPDVEFQTKL